MESKTFISQVICLVVLYPALRNAEHCQGHCQHFNFVIDQDVLHDHALEGHVFKTLTVDRATQCHMMCRDDCLCVSMNFINNVKENNCELSDANEMMEPAAVRYRPGAQYYDLVRSYTVQGRKHIPGKDRCINRCCQPNPCLQGGICQELCDPKAVRFNCTCPDSYTGQRCERIRYPRSCNDIATKGASLDGQYQIYDSQNEPFWVYCDSVSEPDFVWTLIQSFSLGNKAQFANKIFGLDFPVNEDSLEVDWTLYRLSLPRMQSLAEHSTHLRATCNFIQGFQIRDYVRAQLKDHGIFDVFASVCKQYEYVNIRGIECYDCTALTNQNSQATWYINSYTSKYLYSCEFDGRPGMSQAEHNFGKYSLINPDFRCTSSSSSTTEHWFGSRSV